MTVFTWKVKRHDHDTHGLYPLLQTLLTIWFDGYGTTNRKHKAWVGGINYKYFQYDHVGQGARQVGSTFKPFVYATAIEQLNMSPCDSIIDAPFYNANRTPPRNRIGAHVTPIINT
jgi:penicillin-binding protein 1A